MLKITLLTILLLLVSCGESTPVAKRELGRVCGRVLAQTLSLLCNHTYYDNNNNIRNKRDLGSEIDVDYPRGWYFELSYPRMAVRQQHNFERRGVVDECCHQACSISTLMSYCGTP